MSRPGQTKRKDCLVLVNTQCGCREANGDLVSPGVQCGHLMEGRRKQADKGGFPGIKLAPLLCPCCAPQVEHPEPSLHEAGAGGRGHPAAGAQPV